MRCRLQSITVEEISLQTLDKRRNRHGSTLIRVSTILGMYRIVICRIPDSSIVRSILVLRMARPASHFILHWSSASRGRETCKDNLVYTRRIIHSIPYVTPLRN